MKLKYENIQKPSHKKFKKIADFLLYTLPLYQGAIIALPISDTIKMWIGFCVTMITVTVKGLSKFTTDENTNENS